MSFIAPFPGGKGLAINFLTSGISLSPSGLPFGVAQNGRYLVAAISARSGGSTDLTACTIGGVPASIITSIVNGAGGGARCAGLAIAHVPTGDTGSIAITLSGGASSSLFSLFSIFGLSSAAAARSATSTANSPSVNLLVKKGGVAISAAVATALASPGASWVNMTKDSEAFATSITHTGAHASPFSADNASLQLACSFSGTSVSGSAGAFAVFDP